MEHKYIQPIQVQNGLSSHVNKGILQIPQSSRSGALTSDAG